MNFMLNAKGFACLYNGYINRMNARRKQRVMKQKFVGNRFCKHSAMNFGTCAYFWHQMFFEQQVINSIQHTYILAYIFSFGLYLFQKIYRYLTCEDFKTQELNVKEANATCIMSSLKYMQDTRIRLLILETGNIYFCCDRTTIIRPQIN